MKKIYFAAGGTAGHINSAIGLGKFFSNKGYDVYYISGQRHLDYKLLQGTNVVHLPARPIVGKSIALILASIFYNGFCFLKCFFLFLLNRPEFVFGAGGYVCGPSLMAARLLGIKIYLLEQNSVMGLTNKILANFVTYVFTNFSKTSGLDKKYQGKVRQVGNPIRPELYEIRRPSRQFGKFQILVFGGSLGASEINSFIEDLLSQYNDEQELKIIHQTGISKDLNVNHNSKIEYQKCEYIDDMLKAYNEADLIICRGGASTVSELKIVQRPAIIIPTKIHSDQHQVHNARSLKSDVNFPVFIGDCEHLKQESFKEFKQILKEVVSTNYSWMETKTKLPEEKIFELIG